jgi:hypothetical protein
MELLLQAVGRYSMDLRPSISSNKFDGTSIARGPLSVVDHT